MLKYIGKRLLLLIPVLIGITIIVQLLLDITPGDPAKLMLGMHATPERVAELHELLGLDDPLIVRYGHYMMNLLHGDLGVSFTTNRPVLDEMMQRFPYTLVLVSLSLLIAIVMGIPLGVYAATHQNTIKDSASMFTALFFVSMPSFWFALILVQAFGVGLRWLPIAGITSWTGWILPCVSLALGFTASIARQSRSNVLETIRQDYITTARAKGVPEGTVIYRHALKNALTPVIMVAGGMFGTMLGGALVTETIFSIPGLGMYTIQGLNNRDYPVIQSSVLVLSALFAVVILIVDVIFAMVDPRIRSQYVSKNTKRKKEDTKKVRSAS
jgi:peptide/nickel transport system permease protein